MKPAITYPAHWLNENERKGYLFEQWVVNQFPDKDFLLREWRSDKHIGKRAADSGMNPDLIFQCRGAENKFFAIECKFKTTINERIPQWAEEYQIRNYKSFQDKYNMPVFIALGIGGSAHQPQSFSLISLSVLQTVMAPKAIRDKFKRLDFPFSRKTFLPYAKPAVTTSAKADAVYIPTWLKKTS